MHKLRPYNEKMDENQITSSSRGPRLHQDQSFRCFVALRYLKSKKGFFLDLFVILPLPQVRLLSVFYLTG